MSGAAAGLVVPPGSPDDVRAGAGALRRAGQEAADVHARLGSARSAVLGAWSSDAARVFGALSARIEGATELVGTVHTSAAQALDVYADELDDAQRTVRRLIEQLEDAERSMTAQVLGAEQTIREATVRAVDAGAAAAVQEAQDLQQRARAAFDAARTDALRAAAAAADRLRAAADTARRRVQGLVEEVASLKLNDVVDALGAPTSALAVQTMALVGVAGRRTFATLSALRDADWSELMSLLPEQYDEVAGVAARYGEDSLEALDAWLGFQEGAPGAVLRELGHAVDGMGDVPAGGLARGLDLVGKVGLGLGAVTDVLTIADGDASTLDRSLSGANLVGTGMAALGTGAAELVGINAVADWIPVAGEVVMGATAAYLAGEWIYAHRAEIGHAAVAVGHAVGEAATATGHAIAGAAEWTAKEETQMAQASLAAATTVVSGAVHTGEQVASTVEHAASGAAHTAEKAASSAWHFVTSHL